MPTLKKHSKPMPWIEKAKPFGGRRYDDTKELLTPRWRKFRMWYLKQYPICVECKKRGRVVEATVCDHIRPRRLWKDIELCDTDNIQALCKKHHDSKSGKERHCNTKQEWLTMFTK